MGHKALEDMTASEAYSEGRDCALRDYRRGLVYDGGLDGPRYWQRCLETQRRMTTADSSPQWKAYVAGYASID